MPFKKVSRLSNLVNNPLDVALVTDLASVSKANSTVFVKDSLRGGIFNWSATGTANGGTVFAGVTGFWVRSYSEDVRSEWFGAKWDGVTDDTAANQAAINYAATVGSTWKLPTGKSNFTNLYLYYDVSLNPGYPYNVSNPTKQGRFKIKGEGRLYLGDTYFNNQSGSILNCTSGTGAVHQLPPVGQDDYASGYVFDSFTLSGNTSEILFNLQNINGVVFNNILIQNKSLVGHGLYIGKVNTISFHEVEFLGGTAGWSKRHDLYSSGIGVEINGNGGFVRGDIFVGGFGIGIKWSGVHRQSRMGTIEPHHCGIGMVYDGVDIHSGLGVDVFWAEACTYSAIKCINGAPMPSIGSAHIDNMIPDWTVGRAVIYGESVTSNGNTYWCSVPGTTDAATPLSGTGIDITDGTAHWRYTGTLSAEPRRGINIQDPAITYNAGTAILGDIGIVVDSGGVGLYHNGPVSAGQEIRIVSLNFVAYGGAFAGHGIRTGIHNATASRFLHVDTVKYASFATPDVKVVNMVYMGDYHEASRGVAKRIAALASAATLNINDLDVIYITAGASAISAISSGVPGGLLTLFFSVGGITLTHNDTTLRLAGKSSHIFEAGDVVTLQNMNFADGTITWVEVSRCVKSNYDSTGVVEVGAATYTMLPVDGTIIHSAACTDTLPDATLYKGRIITIRTTSAAAITSASSNVSIDGVVGTAILSATAGKWCKLQSNGTNWVMIENN